MRRFTFVSSRETRSGDRCSSTILLHVSHIGHRPDRPLVPGTARTVTETCTGHSQTAAIRRREHSP